MYNLNDKCENDTQIVNFTKNRGFSGKRLGMLADTINLYIEVNYIYELLLCC